MGSNSYVVREYFDIKKIEPRRYELSIRVGEAGWTINHIYNDRDLQSLVNQINEVRGVSSVVKLFNCTESQAVNLLEDWGELYLFHSGEERCKGCEFKRRECFKCKYMCQSPLERSLLFEFRKREVDPVLQRRIRKDGSMYDYPTEINKDTILTIPDFYLEGEKEKVCIYADGGTYHYNNERQGIRDRSIDIALQNLGFKVLRYTGSQIREDVAAVVDGILKSVN